MTGDHVTPPYQRVMQPHVESCGSCQSRHLKRSKYRRDEQGEETGREKDQEAEAKERLQNEGGFGVGEKCKRC